MNTQNFIISLLFLSILTTIVSSCIKTECDTCINASLRDYHGLDACQWVVELQNGEILEPTNLNAFEIQPKDGKKVCVQYKVRQDLMSICMVGKTVDILRLNCLSPVN